MAGDRSVCEARTGDARANSTAWRYRPRRHPPRPGHGGAGPTGLRQPRPRCRPGPRLRPGEDVSPRQGGSRRGVGARRALLRRRAILRRRRTLPRRMACRARRHAGASSRVVEVGLHVRGGVAGACREARGEVAFAPRAGPAAGREPRSARLSPATVSDPLRDAGQRRSGQRRGADRTGPVARNARLEDRGCVNRVSHFRPIARE